VRQYRGRISGPLLDRIDLHVEVPAIPERDILSAPAGEPSSAVRKRVVAAWAVQIRRQRASNYRLQGAELERRVALHGEALGMLREAMSRLALSARACHRVMRVARTVTDLHGSKVVLADHVAEALRYRRESSP